MVIPQEARVKLAKRVQQLQSAVAEGKVASQAAEQHAAGERARMAAAHAAAVANSRKVEPLASCHLLWPSVAGTCNVRKPDLGMARRFMITISKSSSVDLERDLNEALK